MRPVKLHMKNIGPYRDEVLDFTKLDNMFLIKGETGAGKTFIFDSMMFALYGELGGNRKGHLEGFRSKYALDESECFVEFEFEIGNWIYKVHRTVPYTYVNRNGNLSKKQTELDVEHKKKGEANFTPLIGRTNTELNEKLVNLIGLSADEFSRIVVLPQGAFAEFLHQNSKERTETLKKLFPVDFYSRVTEKVAKQYEAVKGNLKSEAALIEKIQNGRDFTDAEKNISGMKKEIKKISDEEKSLSELMKGKNEEITNLERDLKEVFELEKNRSELEDLESQKKDIDLLREKIESAQKASGLRGFLSDKSSTEKAETAARESFDHSVKERDLAQKNFDELNSISAKMESMDKQNQMDGSELVSLQTKIHDAGNLEELQKKRAEVKEEVSCVQKEIESMEQKISSLKKKTGDGKATEILSALSKEIQQLENSRTLLEKERSECERRVNLEKAIADAQENMAQKKEELSQIQEIKKENEIKLEEFRSLAEASKNSNMAYTVSLLLKADCPCPVCGSTSHPEPAGKPGKLLDYSKDISLAEKNISANAALIGSLENEISNKEKRIAEIEEELSGITTKRALEEIQKELDSCLASIEKQNFDYENAKSNFQKLDELVEELSEKQNGLKLAEQNFSSLDAECSTKENALGMSFSEACEKELNLRESLEANKNIFAEWKAKLDAQEKEIAEKKSACEVNKAALESARRNFEKAKAALEKNLSKYGFEDEADAQKVLLSPEEISELNQTVFDYDASCATLEATIKKAEEKNLMPLKKIENHIRSAKAELSEFNDVLAEKKQESQELVEKLSVFESDYNKIKDALEEKTRLEKELAPLKALHSDLSGDNELKLRFETWALGMYFEQVVSFASRRFFDISGERFQFQLKNSGEHKGNAYTGLDLLVYDGHTGQCSDVSSLSGGETFEASISLALALTDVVQNSNGGVQLDSLFIDEGFGTLDPDNLDKAMSVLTGLSESKMVGMISHVSELEDFPGISSAVKINKTDSGSTISIE